MVDSATIQIDALPSLPLAERQQLPGCPAIYFAIAGDGEVLYIGRATSLLGRWRAHQREGQLAEIEGIRLAWLSVDDPSLLPEIERALIKHYEPVLNWTQVPPSSTGMYTVAFRIPEWALRHYQSIAGKERRKLGQVLRMALEDHAKTCKKAA